MSIKSIVAGVIYYSKTNKLLAILWASVSNCCCLTMINTDVLERISCLIQLSVGCGLHLWPCTCPFQNSTAFHSVTPRYSRDPPRLYCSPIETLHIGILDIFNHSSSAAPHFRSPDILGAYKTGRESHCDISLLKRDHLGLRSGKQIITGSWVTCVGSLWGLNPKLSQVALKTWTS